MKTNQDRINYCNCKSMYLDYLNNFLTVEKFAEYYDLSITDAKTVISIGKAKINI